MVLLNRFGNKRLRHLPAAWRELAVPLAPTPIMNMVKRLDENVYEDKSLRDRRGVFADRTDAGGAVADLLAAHGPSEALLLAIPAGGVPVAAVVARRLGWPLEVAVVSKITPPWSTEVGYGAVAFDGTVRMNEAFVARMDMSPDEVRDGVQRTRRKVERRMKLLRGDGPMPDLSGRSVVLVDDGLASGVTMLAAVEACRKAGAAEIVVAVPTAHDDSARRLAKTAARVIAANIRTGFTFAVADAYRHWSDLSEVKVRAILDEFRRSV